MSFNEHDRRTFVADSARAFSERRISKRELLRRLSLAGIGFSGFASTFLGKGRPFGGLTNMNTALAQEQTPDDVKKWLKDVGGKFKGSTIRYTSEATPPTIVANQIAKDEFTSVTGINVEIEIVPLEQVLQKATLDVQGQLGTYDLYYLDQSWTATFINDCVDPREKYKDAELAMPGYDFSDFSKPLVDGICMYGDQMIGVPFDIPIFITMYRKDLFDKHGLKVPTNMDEYMQVVKALDEAERKNGIFGTTGQLKSGHYSLECDWTAWLWGQGGSIFGKDEMFSGGDAEGIEGLEYMLELVKHMPPAVTTWTWDGEGQSAAQGLAGILLSWGEFFPSYDDPKNSKVVGLFEAAHPPKEKKLRTPAEAGFNEIPHIGHQGGSSIALSKYSKNPDAAWVFMQWVTSKDVVARSCTLGGGASPVRESAFSDPRVLAAAKVGPGTTRHFPAIQWTINNAMGSEPDLPSWAEASNNVIPVELGKLLAHQYKSPKECMEAIKPQVDKLAEPFRKS